MSDQTKPLPQITVFVSYRRRDSAALATLIAHELNARGIKGVFVDTRVTDGAGPFPDRLVRAIEECQVFICLLGEETLGSEWVRREIEHAYQNAKPMIPIFQESYIPLKESLSPAIDALLQNNGVPIMDIKNVYMDQALDELVDMIGKTLGINSQPRRRARLVVGAIVAALILVAVASIVLAPILNGTRSSSTRTTEPRVVARNVTESSAEFAVTSASHPSDTATTAPTQPSNTPLPPTALMVTLDYDDTQTAAARLTGTVAQWTKTPTADILSTANGLRTQRAALTATQEALNRTATATQWTKTPTSTQTGTATFTLTFTPLPTVTSTITATPLHAAGFVRVDSKGVSQVYVPAGCFGMGSDKAKDSQAQSDEQSLHEVCFTRAYWIDALEVTNTDYQKFVDDGGYSKPQYWSADGWQWRQSNNTTGPADYTGFTGLKQPRVGVSWYEANAYARWRACRLPTEAEWEYVARGPQDWIYPWGDTWDSTKANADSKVGKTTDVGSYPTGKSWVGAYDMAGNAWEWVNDWFSTDPVYQQVKSDPSGPEAGTARVLRGGSFSERPPYARATFRIGNYPGVRSFNFGLRVVCAATR